MSFFTSRKVIMITFVFCIWGTRDILADFDGNGFIDGADLTSITGGSG